MGTFSEFVKDKPLCEPRMPLIHTCDGFAFRGIVGTQKLSPSPCKVFYDDVLIYFFYGRPAYRTSADDVQTTMNAFMPVSIVLKNDVIHTPKRIAPFDTGAIDEGRYKNHFHPKMKKEDFLVIPSMDMPQRIVNYFFGSNFNYYLGKPLAIDIPPLELEVFSYYSLITETADAPFDDRCSTIEVQVEQPVELTRDNVLLIVLPGIFLDDPKVKDAIDKLWHVQVFGYSIHRGNPKEYIALIYDNVQKFLIDKGFMHT
jgi:hypothetical protein